MNATRLEMLVLHFIIDDTINNRSSQESISYDGS
jgi:hypothetical protein